MFYLFFILICLLIVFGEKDPGRLGESITYRKISGLIEKNNGVILKNLVIPLYEKTTELDMLVITPYGLVVIENKHYKGKIKGDLDDYHWIQCKGLFSEMSFYNPLMQNRTHINALKHWLNKEGIDVPVYNLIVFSHHNSKLKLDRTSANVITVGEIKKWFKYYIFEREKKVNVQEVYKAINNFKLRKHVYS